MSPNDNRTSILSKLAPITASFTLKDHTYDVIRAAILDMNIYDDAADLRMDEREMAVNLGISRTPIREALARLAQDDLVEIVPRKGVFVKRKSMGEVLEMIITWAALESMAARLATENATDAEIASLRSLAAEGAGAGSANLEEYSEANIRFHRRILELSGCAMLGGVADGLFVHMRAVRRRAMSEGDRRTRSVVDHMSIIEAIEARDGALASDLVREHTMRLHDHVRRTWTRIEALSKAKNKDRLAAGSGVLE